LLLFSVPVSVILVHLQATGTPRSQRRFRLLAPATGNRLN